jgi:hypothetical protein
VTDEQKPHLLRRWSHRATVWSVAGAALVAGGSAAALVATSGATTHPAPARTASTADSTDVLDAILGKNPDVGAPVPKLVRDGKLPKPTFAGDTGRVGVPDGVTQPTGTGAPPAAVALPSSGGFSLLQLAALALNAGCSAAQAPVAAAIAAAESGGASGAQGDVSLMDGTWDWSEGLWQIRGLRSERGTGGLRDSLANADPQKNAAAMVTISRGCTDWTPWSTYNSGAYLSYLPLGRAATLAAREYQQRTGSYPPVGQGPAASVPARQRSASSAPKPRPSRTHHKPKPGAPTSSAPAQRRTSAPPAGGGGGGGGQPAPSSSKPGLPVPLPSLPIKPPKPPKRSKPPISLPPLPTTVPPLPLPTTLPPLP